MIEISTNPINKNFNTILAAHFLLISGYIILKLSLANYLKSVGFDLNSAYAITTTSFSLSAICAILWGFLGKYSLSQKSLALLGGLFISSGILLLAFGNKFIQLTGVTFFIIGDSLYFVNIGIMVTRLFENNISRQAASHRYQWIANCGAFIGLVGLTLTPSYFSYQYIYGMGAAAVVIGTSILACFYRLETKNINGHKPLFFLMLCVGIGFVYTLLIQAEITRILCITTFLLAIGVIFYYSFKERNINYKIYLAMIIFCGCSYWVSQTIIYSQFTIFLSQNINNDVWGLHFSPMIVLIFDPIANILVGLFLLKAYKRFQFTANSMLLLSLLLTSLAFGILFLAGSFFKGNISIIFPLLTICLYGVAEFLLLSTLSAQVGNLIKEANRQRFCMALQKIGNAFSASAAYYLISASSYDKLQFATNSNFNLYLIMVIILGCLGFLFWGVMRRLEMNASIAAELVEEG